MKLIINTCYGGFGLSPAAIKRYAEIKGITLFPFTEKRDAARNWNLREYRPLTDQEASDDKNIFSVHYSTKPLNDGRCEEGCYWSVYELQRDDPALVQVVEELGAEADGRFSSLEIVDIPDDIAWELNDYDGIESVHEKHRSWR